MDYELHTLTDPAAVAAAVAEQWIALCQRAVAAHGRFCVALAGGATPQRLYETLAQPGFKERVPWGAVHLFFGDERTVPPGHHDSNYHMAFEALIRHVEMPPAQVYRIAAERSDLDGVARDYAAELSKVVPKDAEGFVVLDLVLLGIGEDGHVASLFPGTTALDEGKALVVPVQVVQLDTWRVTLTYPAINRAANVFILATGERKIPILKRVLGTDGGETTDYPVQRVRPRGRLAWFIDQAAAGYRESSQA